MNAKRLRSLFPLALIALLALGLIAFGYIRQTAASASGPMTGWAWSDTIGWISLSGPNYGLTVGPDGTISGYAWSDNIGWISANSSDLSGCPSAPCTAKVQNGAFSGWLKALAGGTPTSGGWDGWISLSGSGYGVTENNGAVGGYAWGSDIVGWVSFSAAGSFSPVPTISVNPTTVVKGNTVTISWSSSNTSACTGTNFSTGNATSGNTTISPTQTGNYSVMCIGPGGSASATSTVTVTCAPTYSCSNQTIQHTDASCNVSNVTTCTAPSFCSAGSSICLYPSPSFIQSGSQSGHLTAIPQILPSGLTTMLFWDVANVSSCTVTGTDGEHWSGASSPTNGQATSPILQQTTFTLACSGLDGSSINESIVVNVLPVFQER